VVVADIPGLIEGAAEGIGLGHDFLRHVERTRFLIHLVDITQDDPLAAYDVIQRELAAYDIDLADKPQILVLNKIDAVLPEEADIIAAQFPTAPLLISAVAKKNLDQLKQAMWQMLDEIEAQEALAAESSTIEGLELVILDDDI
jgi:GTP-binding protein